MYIELIEAIIRIFTNNNVDDESILHIPFSFSITLNIIGLILMEAYILQQILSLFLSIAQRTGKPRLFCFQSIQINL